MLFKKKYKNNKLVYNLIKSFFINNFIKQTQRQTQTQNTNHINDDNKHTNYLLTHELFKLLLYKNLIQPFYKSVEPFYISSKIHFLQKNITYKNFLTVIRQLANECNIKYTNKKRNFFGTYSFDYTFFI
jgi:hypothetical protein